ncbi:MAG: hypothetical protein ACI4M3_02370, partial [Acutalibacteraceae bacterium]
PTAVAATRDNANVPPMIFFVFAFMIKASLNFFISNYLIINMSQIKQKFAERVEILFFIEIISILSN